MTIARSRVVRLLGAREFQVYEASRRGRVEDHGVARLKALVATARRLHDKYRDATARQSGEARGKRPARGRQAAGAGDNTALKIEIFADVVARFEQALERSEARQLHEGGDGRTRRAGSKKAQKVRKQTEASMETAKKAPAKKAATKAPAKKAATKAPAKKAATKAPAKKAAAKAPAKKAAAKAPAKKAAAKAPAKKAAAKKAPAKKAAAKKSSSKVVRVGAAKAAKKATARKAAKKAAAKKPAVAAKDAIAPRKQVATRTRAHLAHGVARGRRTQAKRDGR